MRGHLFRRNGSWGYVIELPPDPGTGRRRQQRRSGFVSKNEASEQLALALAQRVNGAPVVTTARQMTIRDLMHEWYTAAVPALRPTTAEGYRLAIRNWLIPHFGAVKIREVTPVRLEELYATLSREGGKNGRPLAPRSVKLVHTVLHLAFDRAVRLGYLQTNPAATKIAKPRQPRRRPTVWTPSDARVFLESVENDRLYALWKLMLSTGVRRGEALGLRWQDLDEYSGTIQIIQTVVVVDGKIMYSEPKTEASRRTLYLGPGLIETLRAHRERQNQERKANIAHWQATGLIFANHFGGPIDPNNLSRLFAAQIAQAGVPKIRLHDLRHTVATMALRENINPKLVQELLGHSSVQMTLDIYSHALKGMHQEAMLHLEKILA